MNFLRKRVIALGMSFLLMIICIPSVVFALGKTTDDNEDWKNEAYNGTCGKDVKWHFDQNGTLTIYGSGPMEDYINDGALGGESSLNDYMGYWVPWGELGVKKVVVEEGVTTIGNGAFYESKVSEISLPNTVTSIGSAAFYSDYELKDITLPNSLEYIGRYTFGCTRIQSIVIPDSVCGMGEGAFLYSKLNQVTLSKNMKRIPSRAFYDCPLEICEIPEGVEHIDQYAISAGKLTIPKSVTKIEDDGVWAHVIYGNSGTEAERYANSYGIEFVTNEKFKVVFKDEDGTVISEQTVAYGEDATEPEEPKKESDNYYTYEFSYWDTYFRDVRSDLVVTATYRANDRYYSVTYDTNGGNPADVKPLSVKYGTKLGELPKCTKAGYEFRGWYTDPKGGEEVTSTTEVQKDMTIYAHWNSLKPEKVNITLKFKLGKLTPQISFKTYLGNVSGYQVQYSTSKDYSSDDTMVITPQEVYKMLGGVVKGKTYYVRARAISKEKDSTGHYVYGDWSDSVKL